MSLKLVKSQMRWAGGKRKGYERGCQQLKEDVVKDRNGMAIIIIISHSFACAAFIISWLRLRHWFLSDAIVLKCCKSCMLRSRFPTTCRSLSRVVGSVVRGRPCQPAVSVGAMYSSMAICAGVSCVIRIT